MQDVESVKTYEEFISSLLSLSWRLVERSLQVIRAELNEVLLGGVNMAFTALLSVIENELESESARISLDRIVGARTEFQASVQDIANWFRRPTNLQRRPFDIDVAIGVSLKQIERCYQPVTADLSSVSAIRVAGVYLDGLVEVFFILIQNAIRHSGLAGSAVSVKVDVAKGQEFCIRVSNSLSPHIDVGELREAAREAVERYKRDSALRMARVEGGSGLSKVWRILEFDLKRRHGLSLEVEEHRFTAVIHFDIEGMEAC